MKTLVVLTHSFRLQSRLMEIASLHSSQISFAYYSPYYYSKKSRKIYSESDVEFHQKVLRTLQSKLQDFGYSINIFKVEDPDKHLNELVSREKIDRIYLDKPLFPDIKFSAENLVEVDSDNYIPSCVKKTAKSRWMFWLKNATLKHDILFPRATYYDISGEKPVTDLKERTEFEREVNERWIHLIKSWKDYGKTRNREDGSMRISHMLQHGVIGGKDVIEMLISRINVHKVEKDHLIVPILRQLAFREICIQKAREKNLSLESSAEEWAQALLDEKSLKNLKDEFKETFTRDQLFRGETGDADIDNLIKKTKELRWMPNRARMWFAGEVFYGRGGGFKSLQDLIDFFNYYCEDGQSPNNYVCCTEAMRLNYGRVMRFNRDRTFRLLKGEE